MRLRSSSKGGCDFSFPNKYSMRLILSLKETGALGSMFQKSARQLVSSRVLFHHSRRPANPGEDMGVSVRESHATHEPTASSLSAHPRATALSRPLWTHRQQHRCIWKPWKNSGSQDDLTDECHLQAPQHRPVIAVPAAYCTGYVWKSPWKMPKEHLFALN